MRAIMISSFVCITRIHTGEVKTDITFLFNWFCASSILMHSFPVRLTGQMLWMCSFSCMLRSFSLSTMAILDIGFERTLIFLKLPPPHTPWNAHSARPASKPRSSIRFWEPMWRMRKGNCTPFALNARRNSPRNRTSSRNYPNALVAQQLEPNRQRMRLFRKQKVGGAIPSEGFFISS